MSIRIREENLIRTNVTLSKDVLDKIEEFVKENPDKTNRSVFIRDLINGAFREYQDKKGKSLIDKIYPLELKRIRKV